MLAALFLVLGLWNYLERKMFKIKLAALGIFIAFSIIASWKVAKWKYQQETLQCKIQCRNQILEIADQQKEIFITNEKIIVKYKEVAEVNRSIDRDKLIDGKL